MLTFNPKKQYQFASVKRDGHFTRLLLERGTARVFTRSAVEITSKVRYLPWYSLVNKAAAREPARQEFFGELWLPGGTADNVIHAYCSEDWRLRFDVFGCGHVPRGVSLVDVQREANDVGLVTIPYWQHSDAKKQEYWWGKKDVEGFVFSDGNMANQAKRKPMRTIDLVVLGFCEGTGKNAGKVGSLCVGTAAGEELAAISGFSDAVREMISANRSRFLGRVVEVQYQGVGAGGRLRSPVFLRFRTDKRAEECTAAQF